MDDCLSQTQLTSLLRSMGATAYANREWVHLDVNAASIVLGVANAGACLTTAESVEWIRAFTEKLEAGGSQRNFWAFFFAIQNATSAREATVDGNHRFLTPRLIGYPRHRGAGGPKKVETHLSARNRAHILAKIRAFYTGRETDPAELARLQRELAATVAAHATIRIHFGRPHSIVGVPSTEAWVHNFLLLTGISPPAVVTQAPASFTQSTDGDIHVPHFRLWSASHHRRHVDGWPRARDRKGASPQDIAPVGRNYAGRRKHFREADTRFSWALHDSGDRKVGAQLHHGQCWS
jgi:hypothetical protein